MTDRAEDTAYRRSMRDYIVEHEHLLLRRVAARPGAFAALAVAARTPDWQACSATSLATAMRHANKASLHAMLCLAANPDLDNILEIERACLRRRGLIDPWHAGPSGLFERCCQVFKVALPYAPPKPPKGMRE